jgi:HPt (histidine-containing phosphotransfer) domain-containing protein
MLTTAKLKEYGANVEEGLARCMNNEGFYIRLIGMALSDANFGRLETALAENDLDSAFEAAHALKGVLGNLALSPLFIPASELTEELRGRTGADYQSYYERIRTAKEALEKLSEED